jgi:Ssp1 endopeptidase immunity protein Rap1a
MACVPLIAALPTQGLAQRQPEADAFLTGNQLYSYCNSELSNMRTHCLGYIEGAVDSVPPSSGGKTFFCVPKGVEAGQMRDVVVGYLRNHAESRHQLAAYLVLMALQQAYPCR